MAMNRTLKRVLMASLLVIPGAAMAATIALSGTTVAARPELAGTTIADTSRSIVCNGVTIGTLQDRVLVETGGTYDFYRKVDVTATGWTVQSVKDQQRTWIISGHPDADYRTDSLGSTGPNSLVYESAGGGMYTVEHVFGTNLTTSNNSKFFFSATTSTGYFIVSNVLSVRARYGGVDYVCPLSSSYRSN